ncbi:MAG: hypothetical protein HKN36_12240 [Hellea sp.]|nr:hypothetical protein [Hellea sp.]
MKPIPLLLLSSFMIISCAQADELGAPQLYLENCASCHGTGPEGGSAPSLFDGVLMHGSNLDSLKANIAYGIDDGGMPGFEGGLTDGQITKLALFIQAGDPPALLKKLEKTPAVKLVGSLADQVTIADYITDVDKPWGFVFLDENTLLITEKDGKLLRVETSGTKTEIKGIPEVKSSGQGGLLDVALDPDYSENGWIYLTFSHGMSGKSMTKLVRGKIEGNQWVNEETLFEAKVQHYVSGGRHFGSRITFDAEGRLYFSIGDRGQKEQAQDIGVPNGKIHRINRDGSIPEDNPFRFKDYPSIYSFGNRNPQGLIMHPGSGVLWSTEHGPKGGDEINVIRSGKNYGWPAISYGRNYNGSELTPYQAKPGMEQPASHWTPSIAACGLDVYTGDLFPDWKGRLLAGSLAYQSLRLIEVNDDQYIGEVEILSDEGRIRDVTTGPDGAIYVALPSKIIRLSPRPD